MTPHTVSLHAALEVDVPSIAEERADALELRVVARAELGYEAPLSPKPGEPPPPPLPPSAGAAEKCYNEFAVFVLLDTR